MAKTTEKSLAVTPIVMPAVSTKEALSAWEQYEELRKKIITPEDIQKIEGKDFLKKSYWRKVATFFNLSTEVVEEHNEQIGKTFVWHFTVRATHPNGRSAIGVGSCDAFEKATFVDGKYMTKKVTKWGRTSTGKSFPAEFEWIEAKPNSLHNIRSTAETRAVNRAISNMVGGEVSAEEIVDTNGHTETPATPAVRQAVAAVTGVCRYCGTTGKYHKPNCPGATPVPTAATTSQEAEAATAATEPTVQPTDENGEVVNPEEIPF